MKKSVTAVKVLSLLVAASFLTACSGEPSEGDIKEAIKKERDAMPKEIQGFAPEVTSVKKIACSADGEKAYKCDLELEIKQMGTTTKTTAPVRFVKGSDGWVPSR